jgi:hypothetical protein
MRIDRIWLATSASLALLAAGIMLGCGPSKPTGDDTPPGKTEKDRPKGGDAGGSKTEISAANGLATLKGKVTFVGDKPDLKKLDGQLMQQIEKYEGKAFCIEGATPAELVDQTWKIDDKGGVANVFVFIKPPKGSVFKVDKNPLSETPAEIDQPHCAFIPHCLTLLPGQKLLVKNSAKTNHNTNVPGGGNPIIPAGSSHTFDSLEPTATPTPISCNIHAWMKAYVWPLDHPYATVTKADGTYEMKVPKGAKVMVNAWHESGAYLGPDGSAKGEEITLDKDENVKDFELKAPK